MAITSLSSLFYFQQHVKLIEPPTTVWQWIVGVNMRPAFAKLTCRTTDDNNVFAAAAYVAVHNGLVFLGLGRSRTLDMSYECLYGTNPKSEIIVPHNVLYFGILQTALSATLLFLFLLAIRNYFRIK
jgi:hypothetical protein